MCAEVVRVMHPIKRTLAMPRRQSWTLRLLILSICASLCTLNVPAWATTGQPVAAPQTLPTFTPRATAPQVRDAAVARPLANAPPARLTGTQRALNTSVGGTERQLD